MAPASVAPSMGANGEQRLDPDSRRARGVPAPWVESIFGSPRRSELPLCFGRETPTVPDAECEGLVPGETVDGERWIAARVCLRGRAASKMLLELRARFREAGAPGMQPTA